MRIARWLTLLLCLVALPEFFPRRVQADNPCQQACAANYQSCLANAAGGYDQCEGNASNQLYSCEQQAANAYDSCMSLFYPYVSAAETYCGLRLQEDLQECSDNYVWTEQQCYETQQEANETCGYTYNECYYNCEP